jgi:hypothetical protein
MKTVSRLFALLFTCVLLATIARAAITASTDTPSDAKAIEAYRKGDLDTARTEWIAVLDDAEHAPRGAERGRILYNLGNVAFREGKSLEAVGWYTAAVRLRPRDGDTWANLEQARSSAKLEPADRGDLTATLQRIVRAFTPGEARWLALAGVVLLALGLAFEALRGGRLGRIAAFAGVLAAIVLGIPCLDLHLRTNADPMIAIEADKAIVRSEPREKAAVIGEVPAGDEIERRDQLAEWTKVRLEGGIEGWTRKTAVFPLRR